MTWWHVHSGPPYICRGGAQRRVNADDLAEIHREDGLTVVVVESKDDPRDCAYVQPGWTILHGTVAPN